MKIKRLRTIALEIFKTLNVNRSTRALGLPTWNFLPGNI